MTGLLWLRQVSGRWINSSSLGVLCVFILLALFATFPAIFRLSFALIGAPEGDSYEMMWLIWWLREALLDSTITPTEIPILFYPEGLSFPILATQMGAQTLALPIAIVSSPAVAFNVIMVGALAFSGWTAYWLGFSLTGNRLAGALCGLVWAFFPNKMGHALGGHLYQVAVFWLPLFGLSLWRVLAKPSFSRGLLTGLSAALVASVHSVHVVYFLMPTSLVLLLSDWSDNRPGYWTTQRLVAVGTALLVASALLVPLYVPVFAQVARGELGFMAATGSVGFSVDLGSFFVPAPENPLLRMFPAVREFSHRVNVTFNETIAYLGVMPVALAICAIWSGWSVARRWVLLGGVAAVLSLGPLFKFGGRVVEMQVDDISSPILLPYAFMQEIPFMEWSRAPARLHETTQFALAVLVAYGSAALLTRIGSRVVRLAFVAMVGGFIFIEYLVAWPFPVARIERSEVFGVAREQPGVVLPLPANARETASEALLAQTVHGQPMIGGRLLRNMTERTHPQRFLHQLSLTRGVVGADIIPAMDQQERLQMLREFEVSWVAYHDVDEAVDGDPRAVLAALLGPPVVSRQDMALYSVSQGQKQIRDVVYALGENWHNLEDWGGVPTRWFHGNGEVFVHSNNERDVQLSLTLIPEMEPHSIAVKVNGVQVAEFLSGDWLPFMTEPFSVRSGLNVIELVDLHGVRVYVGDLRCAGGTPMSGPFDKELACESAHSMTRAISAGVQDLRIQPVVANPAPQAVFDDNVSLLESSWERDVKAGDSLRLVLYWRAEEQVKSDWTAFVHLVSVDGALVAGLDQEPMGGRIPTNTWSPGQVVAYSIAIPVPRSASAGEYRINVGWYEWPEMQRISARSDFLPVADQVITLGKAFVHHSEGTVTPP